MRQYYHFTPLGWLLYPMARIGSSFSQMEKTHSHRRLIELSDSIAALLQSRRMVVGSTSTLMELEHTR